MSRVDSSLRRMRSSLAIWISNPLEPRFTIACSDAPAELAGGQRGEISSCHGVSGRTERKVERRFASRSWSPVSGTNHAESEDGVTTAVTIARGYTSVLVTTCPVSYARRLRPSVRDSPVRGSTPSSQVRSRSHRRYLLPGTGARPQRRDQPLVPHRPT